MHVNTITDALSVSSQITAETIPALKAAGFRSIICNRPDGESWGQPSYAALETAARAAGLDMRHLPVQSGSVQEQDAVAFGTLLHDLPKPVLAYCRSGARSAMLWSLYQSLAPQEADSLSLIPASAQA